MSEIKFLSYPLVAGYIHNWLTMPASLRPDAQRDMPYENAEITVDGNTHKWQYARADLSHRLYVDGTVFARLLIDERVTLHPGQYVGLDSPVTLEPGTHDLFLPTSGVFAVRVDGSTDAVTVQIPTKVERPDRRQKFERVFDFATLDRDIYADGARVVVNWPQGFDERTNVWAQMQHESGRTYAEARKMLDADDRSITLNRADAVPSGRYHVLLTPQPDEYYNGLKYERRLPFRVVRERHSSALYGSDDSRRREALEHVVAQRGKPFTEIARRARDGVSPVDPTAQAAVGSLDLNQQAVWLQRLCREGFVVQGEVPETIMQLVHLVEYANLDEVAELAAVALDKLLFTMALNTYRGVVSTLFARADGVPNGRVHPLSGVSRLLWGTGTSNEHAAVVALAASEQYQVPSLVQAIALDSTTVDSVERHRAGERVITRKTRRTADYLLSSMEASWQATLSPDGVVTTSHASGYQPVTPSAAQWSTRHTSQYGDVVICLYSPPDGEAMPFTSAYFPLYALDEYTIRDGWAFAQVGDGYLALTASAGFDLITHGDTAHRELRSPGMQCAWVCHMGTATEDGTFTDFQNATLAIDTTMTHRHVALTTLRGNRLEFSADAGLTIDDVAQQIDENAHYRSPYSNTDFDAPSMDIQYGEYVMRLNFSTEEETP